MKGKVLGKCYLKVHLSQSSTVLSPSSIKLLWGDVLSEEVLCQYITLHHPWLFTGMLGELEPLRKVNLEIIKEEICNLSKKRKRTKANDMFILAQERNMHEWINIIRFFC